MSPRSRKDAWLRDELVLALDLYVRLGRNPPASHIDEVSDLLRALPIEPWLARDPKFRGRSSVRLKLGNFAAIDPNSGIIGMPRVGQGDREVWRIFAGNPDHLAQAASAIRSNAPLLTPEDAGSEEEGITEAPEGRLLTRAHRARERSAKLVGRRKAEALSCSGRLACEVCGFDFAEAYGEYGAGYIECHHLVPLRQLQPGTRTRLADLALVCANCHRTIHRRSQWLTVEELRSIFTANAGGNPTASVGR